MAHTPTVVVLGCSYGGSRAVTTLTHSLPPPWRVVVIERNTHTNHLYVFPRVAVVPNHEHKAFIPYTNLFKVNRINSPDAPELTDPSNHVFIHGHVTHISERSVSYVPLSDPSISGEEQIEFDYLIYALGSHLPAPINIWSNTPDHAPPKVAPGSRASSLSTSPSIASIPGTPSSSPPIRLQHITASLRALGGLTTPSTPSIFRDHDVFDINRLDLSKLTIMEDEDSDVPRYHLQRGTKPEGVQWLQAAQQRVKEAASVLVIGGGALGVQFASDIAAFYPEKRVTLVHSGTQLLPRFDPWLHEETMKVLKELGVTVLLSSRVDLSSKTKSTLQTCDGRLISAELILLCTGQKPNTSLLSSIAPHSINPRTGMVSVLRSMQIGYYEKPRRHNPAFACAQGLDESECHCRENFNFGVSENAASDEAHTEQGPSPIPHIFVVGDAADAFGALNAGHTAWSQAEVAARNVVKLIRSNGAARLAPVALPIKLRRSSRSSSDLHKEKARVWNVIPGPTVTVASKDEHKLAPVNDDMVLDSYSPPPPSIKVTLGLSRAVYQTRGTFGLRGPEECPLDLAAPNMWKRRGLSTEDMTI